MVDCSVGTPCDAPPAAVVRALAASGTERGYPAVGRRPRAAPGRGRLARRRFGVAIDAAAVAACVGTKELVASYAHYLHLRDPSRDTVLYPAVSYPTYAMGAALAGCRAVPVPPATADGSGLDLDAVDPADAERALLLWANSPANPSGGLTDLAGGGRVGPPARGAGLLRRVLRRVHLGGPAPLGAAVGDRRAWSPCTPSPSGRTWPGCGRASSPGTPSWWATCATCASTPA